MRNLTEQEVKKFVNGHIEKYLKTDEPSRKRTAIELKGSIEGVAEAIFCLNISEQIYPKAIKVKVSEEHDLAVASCIGYAPAYGEK